MVNTKILKVSINFFYQTMNFICCVSYSDVFLHIKLNRIKIETDCLVGLIDQIEFCRPDRYPILQHSKTALAFIGHLE